jgi:hypothetical protein
MLLFEIHGDPLTNKENILKELILNRVKGGKPTVSFLKIAAKYNSNPSASIVDLTKAYIMIQNLNEEH